MHLRIKIKKSALYYNLIRSKRIIGLIVTTSNSLNYSVLPFIMQIKLAGIKCNKCIIKFLCKKKSLYYKLINLSLSFKHLSTLYYNLQFNYLI
jgi:hypothetical protein